MKKIVLLFIIVSIATAASSRIIYVRVPSLGIINGTSWRNSYVSLSAAITTSVSGDTIKVAAGTYNPGIQASSYFSMKSGVVVLGGYSSDSTITTRNWSLYPSILTGAIGSPVYSGDNINTILRGSDLNSNTVWDGFIIEDSYNQTVGNGCVMLSGNSQPALRNLLFRSIFGNVIVCVASSPGFMNCIFFKNDASYNKSIIYNQLNSSPKFYGCLFANNLSSDIASVMFNSQSSTQIVNCTFYNNEVGFDHPRTTIAATDNSSLAITNSIFFYNKVRYDYRAASVYGFTLDSSELYLSASTASVSNSILQNYTNGASLQVGVNPRFKDTSDIDGPDNRFFTADDGLQLTNPCSHALNSGNNSAIAGVSTDLAGNPRVFNNGVVDLGAYEFQGALSTPLHTVYVNKLATGSNDGSTWQNAFTDLQKALQYCSDTIKVAAGTYVPSSANPGSSFWLSNKLVVLGGYPNTGSPGDVSWDPQVNLTTLSGKLPAANTNSYVVVKCSRIDSTSVLDGFVIKQGGALDWGYLETGGMYFVNSSARIRNCRITSNSGTYDNGGGIVCKSGSRPFFYNCVIDSNGVGQHGGGSASYFSSPRFVKCIFRSNSSFIDASVSPYNGGAVYNVSSNPSFDSCSFIKNIANDYGGGFYNVHSNPVISNSIFENNAAGRGGDIYNLTSSPLVTNCKFAGTGQSEYGAKVYNTDTSSPIFRFCEFSNGSASTGGAVYNDYSSAEFTSCVFFNNNAYNNGAVDSKNNRKLLFTNCIGVFNSRCFLNNEQGTVDIINCTFTRNGPAGGIVISSSGANLTIRNSILWANNNYATITPSPDIFSASGNTQIFNSVTQAYGVNGVNGNFVGVDPKMFEFNDPDGLDNVFLTADDGLRLTPCSPVINAGANGYNTETTDILKNPRIFGSSVDIGALRIPGAPHQYSQNILRKSPGKGQR